MLSPQRPTTPNFCSLLCYAGTLALFLSSVLYTWAQQPAYLNLNPSASSFSASSSHYQDGYNHDASHGPAHSRPSSDFPDLQDYESVSFRSYNPYPDYNSPSWKAKWHGSHRSCLGPRGVNVNGNLEDKLHAYRAGSILKISEPIFGSYHESGLDSDHCFERDGRLRPYGFDGGQRDNASTAVNWTAADWGQLQIECTTRNEDRYFNLPDAQDFFAKFQPPSAPGNEELPEMVNMPAPRSASGTRALPGKNTMQGKFGMQYKKRTAVVLRSHDKMDYKSDVLMFIRSLIMELSLHSGGEYAVFLLVEVKDDRDLFNSSQGYQAALDEFVPKEFHTMTLLWNTKALLGKWYPKVDVSMTQMQHMDQPLQLFSRLHPEYAHTWMLEMDVRFTGHWYNLFENADAWSRAQPRKLLWERNSRFFMPHIHNTFANFTKMVEQQTEDGGVWGAPFDKAVPHPLGPSPPVKRPSEDNYIWGVGEDADLLALAPLVPGPKCPLDLKFGIHKGFPDAPSPPMHFLDATVVVRMSKQLLGIMHDAQVAYGVDAEPELAPGMFTYLHGLKGVSFPLPTFFDPVGDDMPYELADVDREFNTQGAWETIWRFPRPERLNEILTRVSYIWNLFRPQYAPDLYKWWILGRKVGSQGEDAERKGSGRLCMPGALLHPVKKIKNV